MRTLSPATSATRYSPDFATCSARPTQNQSAKKMRSRSRENQSSETYAARGSVRSSPLDMHNCSPGFRFALAARSVRIGQAATGVKTAVHATDVFGASACHCLVRSSDFFGGLCVGGQQFFVDGDRGAG